MKSVKKAGEIVDLIPREELRRKKRNQERMKNSNAFFSVYDGHSKMIKRVICKYWDMLKADTKYGSLFKEKPRFVYKRGKSIGDRLVRSDIKKKRVSKQTLLSAKKTWYISVWLMPELQCSNKRGQCGPSHEGN